MAAVLAARLHHDRHAMQVTPMDDDDDARPSPKPSATDSAAATKGVELSSWTVTAVARWLTEQGQHEVAKAATRARVDGAMLLELDAAAWQELGVSTALERARLAAAVKRAAALAASDADRRKAGTVATVSAQDFAGGRTGKKHEQRVRMHFVTGSPPCCARTPDGGAEHTSGWGLCICNANANPAEVKQHFLRFMGMYNVIDLLVLTINLSYLISAELSKTGPDSLCSLIIVTLMGFSGTLSGLGMGISTIFYNSASAVSDANFIVFAKLPQTIRSLRLVNDLSIISGNITCMSIAFFAYRICVELVPATWKNWLTGETYEIRWYYACAGWIVPALALLWNMPILFKGVLSSTHSAMYGGLMSSEPIRPLADDPTWAHRSSSEEISRYVAESAIANGQPKRPAQCENGCATMYAETTVSHMTGDVESFALDAAADGAGILSSLASIITLASSRAKVGSSFSGGGGLTRLVSD